MKSGISIKEISQKAGVSIATVSRVINKKGRYSKDTEERVMRIIEENHYEPNLVARGLRVQRMKNVGIIVPDITNEFFMKLVHKIEKELFAQGYETMVGERGVTLSGGQTQRAAIARMLTQNTPIMIFDDSLSAVDTETEKQIQHSLKELDFPCTKLIIAQRISSVQYADRIIVMEDGRIDAFASHEELLANNEIYQDIYSSQVGEGGVDNG